MIVRCDMCGWENVCEYKGDFAEYQEKIRASLRKLGRQARDYHYRFDARAVCRMGKERSNNK